MHNRQEPKIFGGILYAYRSVFVATRPVLQGNILDPATLRTQKEYPLKLEPIVHLSSARTFGYEVLTQVPFHVNTEHFFHHLSSEKIVANFYQQVATITHYPKGVHYFLNLPLKVFLHLDFFNSGVTPCPSNLILEIQDPETLFSLNSRQRSQLYEKIKQVESIGIPVWLDDVDENLIKEVAAARWHFSGLKLDKNAFWDLILHPQKLRQVIFMGYNIADVILIEGIENHAQKEIAFHSGAQLGQGYLWPALLQNKE
ncbi:TPA: EAL domain-containing protein [Citrobacter koseri]|nr:EAL domain-containing protein [Citrobacter koseri]